MKKIIMEEINLKCKFEMLEKIKKECKFLLWKKENTDFNDVYNYINVMFVNIDECAKMRENWIVSSKYNSKTTNDIEFGIYRVDTSYGIKETLNLYIIDGNGKRRTAKDSANFTKPKFPKSSLEECIKNTEEMLEKVNKMIADIQKIFAENSEKNENEIEIHYSDYIKNYKCNPEMIKIWKQKKGGYNAVTKTIILEKI